MCRGFDAYASETDLAMVQGNGNVDSMLPKLRACVHPLRCFQKVLTQEQHYHIHQRLCTILAEEVCPPPHHLILEVSQGKGRG